MSISEIFGRLTTVSMAVLLSACATPPVYHIGPSIAPQGNNSITKVAIDDKRPESDKTNSVGSFFVGSDDYGILTLGDAVFTPPMIDALRLSVLQSTSLVSERAPHQIDIKVDRMFVQDNRQQLFLAQGSRGLLLPTVLGEALSGKEINFNKTDPFIVATFKGSATIDGVTKAISVSKQSAGYQANAQDGRERAVKDTLRDFLEAISAQVTGASNNAQRHNSVRTDNRNNVSAPGAHVGNTAANQKPTINKTPEQKFGKSSYQIEQMAKSVGCRGGSGAYLTTEAGAIEGYRIDCEGGAAYLARCEYGRCTAQ